jgi:hypothetical protein
MPRSIFVEIVELESLNVCAVFISLINQRTWPIDFEKEI